MMFIKGSKLIFVSLMCPLLQEDLPVDFFSKALAQ